MPTDGILRMAATISPGDVPVSADQLRSPDPRTDPDRLVRTELVRDAQRVQRVRQEAQRRAAAPKPAPVTTTPTTASAAVVRPTNGRFTSGFGGRWGSTHYGIDLAAPIGTPIVSVAAGTVVEAGPASGFGLWVRVRHDDGTVTVYGHVNEIMAATGTRVRAGQQIATVGNRGHSTGPHLHFEVWRQGSEKTDPLPWLAARGVSVR